MQEAILILIGAAGGLAIGWLWARQKFGSSSDAIQAQLDIRAKQVEALEIESKALRETAESARQQVTREETERQSLQKRLSEQKEEVEKIRLQMQKDFELLAQKIFDEKSNKFTKQNKENLESILKPLGERIKDFETKVDRSNKENLEKHTELKAHLENIRKLNLEMTEEAKNLTKALKGDTKKQGIWGEQVLEKLLEYSGLRKGKEYHTEVNFTDAETGNRSRPDAIVHLPDEKDIIIDSKVSLVAYEQWVNAEDEDDRARFAKEHLASIKGHIKSLNEKNYQDIAGIKTLDFVVLFIPIEPAFSLAIQQDDQIYTDSLKRNIVLVSPSTLLVTLRTIASIWKQENQSRNAVEIAREAGNLYDKFVGFVEDLDKIGKRINDSQRAYDAARNKLTDGKGNLVRRVEKLRKMGADASKKLDTSKLEEPIEDEES